MKKVILKVFFHDEKAKRKGMKSVSGLQGVESISMDTKDQKLTVIGDIDPVDVVRKLRKLCFTEILSVGSAKEEKKEEPKKEEPKKDDKKKDEIAEPLKAYEAYYISHGYYPDDKLLKAYQAYFRAHGEYPDDELLKAYQAYFTAHGYYPNYERLKAYQAYFTAHGYYPDDKLLKAYQAYFRAHGYYPDDELLKAYQAFFTAHGYYPDDERLKAYQAYFTAHGYYPDDKLLKAYQAYFRAHGYYPDDELLKAYQAYFTAHGYYPAAQQNYFVRSVEEDTFDLCHLFQGEQFDDNKDDKIETSISSSLITTISSYADNLDPLDLNEDPPDLAKEAQLQCYEFLPEPFAEEGIEKQITSESQGMVFDVETVEMKSSGEKIGVEFEASGQDKKFEIEDIRIERPETSDIDRNTFSIIQGEAHQLCLMLGGLGLTEMPKEEDWKNVKEIYLMHNELSSLPENPRCPMLLVLFLQGNHKLRTIPPSFFDNMPALQILNLSRTGIRSLPESIFRLVNLKRLFLSYCHRFMRLSPKVGELKQLEVLDLEGTDIMDLPKEIKELTNLTCLEVSFYAYLSNVRRAMQSDVVVPCGIISALSHLEELNMSVNPDDKRWSACVEAIVTEVCTLQSLNTLKFYFPSVELMRLFLLNSPMWVHPSLSNFIFTVGHHVQRTMSRLPRDVEFELERWERCLKYINGEVVPEEIKKVLHYSTAFLLERHATVKKLSDFGIGNMKHQKCCVVGECNEVEVIIDATDAYEEDSEANAHEEDDEAYAHVRDSEADAHEGDGETNAHEGDSEADKEDSEADAHEEDDEVEAYREDGSSGIVSKTSGAKKIVLGSLEYLYIYYMKNLRRIWKGPIQPKCLSLLKSLTLHTCPKLTTIFTTCLLDNLCNLEELTVEDCPSIKTLVSCKISAEPKTSDFLPNLKRISLHYMPGLISISSGLHIASRLECLSFYNCPNLKHLLIEEVSSKDLKKIKGEWNWWVALKWRYGRPSYLDDIFVPINI